MIRVQMTLTVNGSVKDEAALRRLEREIGFMDWVALHEISQGGEDPKPFFSGGFNPSGVSRDSG